LETTAGAIAIANAAGRFVNRPYRTTLSARGRRSRVVARLPHLRSITLGRSAVSEVEATQGGVTFADAIATPSDGSQ